ncbi:MAG: bifunctional methylenetetrahydrofolate dehydrogenase/methenyltetrahydrofolate cyclohydrolase FolD [Planctomycetota bacterium]|jgi:methylenetetrahydrofolate dehydrogenase (NADP+)/methenyltetrahydrofolate cyclohydrolase|nr:bifunctional methylenetetrahydrofolate dehydrogenase/methenyltetrahydrofolate cyclohydrolase FolD [Blastopirellula sp.]
MSSLNAHTRPLILDGKAIGNQIQKEIKQQVDEFIFRTKRQPTLAVVLVGGDPASQVYVAHKEKGCAKVGLASQRHFLPEATTTGELLALVQQLNADPAVTGILVQLPLPKQIDGTAVLDAIDWRKDVDAFHPTNVGLLSQGRPRFLPCTPFGILQVLYRSGIKVAGKRVVVIGRSDIVGKPIAAMLVQRTGPFGPDFANATVTICHSQTPQLEEVTRSGDILIAAIGQPKFVTAEMVKPGAVVIDVGINRLESGLVGDVDYDGLLPTVSAITPVPGGIGPLTVTMLLHNTLLAARLQWGE